MKRIINILSIITLIMGFNACDEVLDINTDPLAATEANPNAVLPFVFAEYTARKTTELGTRMCDVYQHFSATFNSPRNGSVPVFLTGNVWANFYPNLLGNLTLVESDAEEAGELQDGVRAVSIIMQSHIFFELTSIYEDIPFTEALDQETFPQPQFDTQEAVLKGIINRLDQAIGLIDDFLGTDGNEPEGAFNFDAGDLLFDGDLTDWRALANSIKIRTLMLIRNVQPSFADPLLQAAFNEPTVSEPVYIEYEGTSPATNGYYDLVREFFGTSNEDFFVFGPAPALVDQLQRTNDPRLNQWIVDLSGTGEFPAAEYGTRPNRSEAVFSDNLLRGDLPDIYFLPSEISLYRAELILEGVLSGSAQTAFEEGVTYAVNFWGGGGSSADDRVDGYVGTPVSSAEVAAFVSGLGSVTLKKIHEQLWLESWMRPVLSWNTIRRTGTPALEPPPGSQIDTILKRFPYPPDESAANQNAPSNKKTDVPMWFENL